jgi:hypothetical protein
VLKLVRRNGTHGTVYGQVVDIIYVTARRPNPFLSASRPNSALDLLTDRGYFTAAAAEYKTSSWRER